MYRLIAIASLLLLSLHCAAETSGSFIAVSPANRVALLELYTSEGCSSCPPADRFMSRLKQGDPGDQQLIPLSFHVTYWDYIGWRDRFANRQYDQRQRSQVKLNGSRTVYTPQFMLNGKDYRRLRDLDEDVRRINSSAAAYRLELTAMPQTGSIIAELDISSNDGDKDKTVAYIAFYEHGLKSDVTDGENDGETLHHDYVVRELHGPYVIEQGRGRFNTEFAVQGYRLANCGIVAYVQKLRSSEVLQAVSVAIGQ
ncbi:MAG: DUF1223 domain-containing protein [Gammaproteobacteria bacterium]|nr:DUF1223 domain-containing protein [Gammaproteobacteria bacterium]